MMNRRQIYIPTKPNLARNWCRIEYMSLEREFEHDTRVLLVLLCPCTVHIHMVNSYNICSLNCKIAALPSSDLVHTSLICVE